MAPPPAALGAPPKWRLTAWQLEMTALLGLATLFIFFVARSWRKWPDPLVDFGRELYQPWRIANGAVLFRDLEGHYGPLSQYFNGLLFKVFGPGVMVLATANLVIFAGILTAFYLICRRGWGTLAAFSGTAVFISVFGFTQLVKISNYTYAAPYAHETTHGMMLVLLLILVLMRWVRDPRPRWSFLAGFLLGLALVLKAEFVLVSGSLGLTAFALRWRRAGPPNLRAVALGILGAALPVFLFTAYFALYSPWSVAFANATHRSLFFARPATVVNAVGGVQAEFTGINKAGTHFAEHAYASLEACLLAAAIGAIGWATKRVTQPWTVAGIASLAGAGICALSIRFITWPEIGRCLFGLVILYAAWRAFTALRSGASDENFARGVPRLLLAVLAVTLMTRMALNGRIYHYGFYQAAIAGCLIPVVFMRDIGEWIQADARARLVIALLSAALFVPGVYAIAHDSNTWLALKTWAIGEGRDRFFVFDRRGDPTGEIVGAVSEDLKKSGTISSLIVVPEGIMINYLTRVPSPVPYYFYWAPNAAVLEALESHAPERVVIISRDLREYGIQRYGKHPGQGKELLDWLSTKYLRFAHAGGDPLDVKQRGAVVLKRSDLP